MGFIKIFDSFVEKIFVGEQAVKNVYVGQNRIYPNIVSVDTGADYGEWSYADPTRTRTVRLWEQDIYADGSRGEKRYTGTSTETQTASASTDWDGATYWNGACGSNYYYVDYKKVRTKYAYADIARYGDWCNGDSRSRRVDGQCGWVRDWRVTADWSNTGSTCNSAGTVGQYDCDGTYTVKYNQQKRTLSYCYPDMSGSTQTKTEYRAGSVASRSQVDGQCGYVAKPTIRLRVGALAGSNSCNVVALPAVRDDIMVSIVIETSDNGDTNGSAFIKTGGTGGSASLWPPIFDESTVTYTYIQGVNYNGKLYSTPPLTTDNAIYQW